MAFFKEAKDVNSAFSSFDFAKLHSLAVNSLPNKAPLFGNFCWEKSCSHLWKKGEEKIMDVFKASGMPN
jgi:hypothetical protein